MPIDHIGDDELSADLERISADGVVPVAYPGRTAADRSRRTVVMAVSAAALLVVALSVAIVRATPPGPAAAARTYPLASNGWTPEQPSLSARFGGAFQAAPGTVDGVVCGWLGSADDPHPTLWPAGWRVRLHPVQLIEPSGKVFADAGDLLHAAGGGLGPERSGLTGCGPASSGGATLGMLTIGP